MKQYTFLIIAISFLAMVAGTAVAQTSNSTEDNRCRQDVRNTGQSFNLNDVNGSCPANPYPF